MPKKFLFVQRIRLASRDRTRLSESIHRFSTKRHLYSVESHVYYQFCSIQIPQCYQLFIRLS